MQEGGSLRRCWVENLRIIAFLVSRHMRCSDFSKQAKFARKIHPVTQQSGTQTSWSRMRMPMSHTASSDQAILEFIRCIRHLSSCSVFYRCVVPMRSAMVNCGDWMWVCHAACSMLLLRQVPVGTPYQSPLLSIRLAWEQITPAVLSACDSPPLYHLKQGSAGVMCYQMVLWGAFQSGYTARRHCQAVPFLRKAYQPHMHAHAAGSGVHEGMSSQQSLTMPSRGVWGLQLTASMRGQVLEITRDAQGRSVKRLLTAIPVSNGIPTGVPYCHVRW